MANTKSAKKRILINKKNRTQNNSYKSIIKSSTKQYLELLKNPEKSNISLAKYYLDTLYSGIDKAKKKNVLHKNTAARKKSRLARLFNKTFM